MTKKTNQQKEGESIFKKIWKLFTEKKYEIRSATLTDTLVEKGGKRLVVFLREKDK